ncbi:carbonic anhydrase [Methylophilus medardicus]|uniref:carbonic anhydrase n=1 Tax=Methylophilus medardicus TaxID=2588534 RepID=A0A5B8CT03_9PROT|nr:carbonic anhydrase [Methylophilus medardicus]QDC44417.1 carbonic anhydrase [Methylophilus medardicus]QDC49424.1 carbonic anhydrase [Methylophilus medardicus]QDC53129.1 carbonic anhydrase [Methylophilus medardicus]
MYKHPLLDREKMTPREALDILIEGNRRFANDREQDKDFKSLIQITKDKQHPFSSFLSCSDSRAPVELLFDQALGDVFSVRLAGNIASDKAIGSLEFASKYLGSKLIVVMGHSSCGAVKAACDDFKDGHIGEIINLIKPAIRHEKTITDADQRNSKNSDFVEKICALNVKYQIDTIIRCSDIVDDMLQSKQIGIVGAVYDISNGKVNFLEDTFIG